MQMSLFVTVSPGYFVKAFYSVRRAERVWSESHTEANSAVVVTHLVTGRREQHRREVTGIQLSTTRQARPSLPLC